MEYFGRDSMALQPRRKRSLVSLPGEDSEMSIIQSMGKNLPLSEFTWTMNVHSRSLQGLLLGTD